MNSLPAHNPCLLPPACLVLSPQVCVQVPVRCSEAAVAHTSLSWGPRCAAGTGRHIAPPPPQHACDCIQSPPTLSACMLIGPVTPRPVVERCVAAAGAGLGQWQQASSSNQPQDPVPGPRSSMSMDPALMQVQPCAQPCLCLCC